MSEHLSTPPECRQCARLPGRAVASLSGASEGSIGRRTFLVQSGILAAIAALEACGSLGTNDVTAPNVPSNTTITVGNYPSLANVGGVALIDIGAAPIAIVRTGSSTFIALSRICPHQGGTIGLSQNDFVCPVHGATFNLSGQWIGGQRTSNMHSYTTSYDATTGVLTIS
jgi:Rieske Fe-S protein